MKMIKKDQESKREIITETCLKKTKTKKENMEKTDTMSKEKNED